MNSACCVTLMDFCLPELFHWSNPKLDWNPKNSTKRKPQVTAKANVLHHTMDVPSPH